MATVQMVNGAAAVELEKKVYAVMNQRKRILVKTSFSLMYVM